MLAVVVEPAEVVDSCSSHPSHNNGNISRIRCYSTSITYSCFNGNTNKGTEYIACMGVSKIKEVLKNTNLVVVVIENQSNSITIERLRSLSTDAASQLDILGHDGDTLGMDSTKVGVLEETHKVSLGRLLQGKHGGSLEAEVSLEVLGDLTHKSLEGELADKKLGGLLVSADLSESHGTGSVAMGLLDSASGGGRLAVCLGGELLSGGLASSGLSCGLLSTGHCCLFLLKIVSQF